MPTSANNAPALTALGAGLFDYAGLYPPAALPIPEAVEEYHRLLESSEAWCVGPFVVDAGRLANVATASATHRPDAPLRVSLLAGTRRPLEEDVETTATLLEAGQHAFVSIAQVETVWPTTAEKPDTQLAEVRAAIAPLSASRLFLEVPPDTPDLASLAAAVSGVGAAREMAAGDQPLTGLKIRCGGPTPSDVPPVRDVAHFLRTCALQDAPFKATAGLHHPVRAYHKPFGGFQHGFLNVFVAALLLSEDTRRDPATIEALLQETDAAAFAVEPDAIIWRGVRVGLPAIERGRGLFATSIGSCSVSEPVEDLRAMAWL